MDLNDPGFVPPWAWAGGPDNAVYLQKVVDEREERERRRRILEQMVAASGGRLDIQLSFANLGLTARLPGLHGLLKVGPDPATDMLSHAVEDVILELRAKVLSEQLPPVTIAEESTIVSLEARAVLVHEVPLTWWDHWKADHERSWWAGWFARWRGHRLRQCRAEKVERDKREVTLSVDLRGKIHYPEAKIPVRPDDFGRSFVWAHLAPSMSATDITP